MIRLENLRKAYRGAPAPAVDGLSLSVAEGDLVTLLGASGCGKTTTLRCLAGIEEPDSGEILIDGEPVFSSTRGIAVPPHKRPIGMVFQSYAIWPHMTVFENVAYPLRSAGIKGAAVTEAVRWALSLVNLEAFADRPAPLLSGGQQQRVALARALADRPRVLLLDEPLSNLDAKLRDQVRVELRDLLKRLKITAVYVTHDQDDAFTLSDVTALMAGGRIVEIGRPEDIYQRPQTAFAARFLGFSTEIDGTVTAVTDATDAVADVETPVGSVRATFHGALAVGQPVSVFVRPEEFAVLPEGARTGDSLAVALDRVGILGGAVEWSGRANGIALRGRVQAGSAEDRRLRSAGGAIDVRVATVRCVPRV